MSLEKLRKKGKALQVDVPVFEMGTEANPVDIAREGLKFAEREGYDSIIVDTAGRLQVGPTRVFRRVCEPIPVTDSSLEAAP